MTDSLTLNKTNDYFLDQLMPQHEVLAIFGFNNSNQFSGPEPYRYQNLYSIPQVNFGQRVYYPANAIMQVAVFLDYLDTLEAGVVDVQDRPALLNELLEDTAVGQIDVMAEALRNPGPRYKRYLQFRETGYSELPAEPYHRYLTAAEYAEKLGISRAALYARQAQDYVTFHGLRLYKNV